MEGAIIYCSTGSSFIEYINPITLTDPVSISAYVQKEYYTDSPVSQVQLTINKQNLSNIIIENPAQGTPEWVIWKL